MSRHLWNANRSRPDDPSQRDPEGQQPGIFAATIRAVRGLTGPPAAEAPTGSGPYSGSGVLPTPEPGANPDPGEAGVPMPRTTTEDVEPIPSAAETTDELPRYVESEPAEPALAMLSRGRHGIW